MRNHRRHKNKVNNGMVNIERDYESTDDLHYFIEKLRNKGKSVSVALYSEINEPEYVKHYVNFMEQYIGFTLTNISAIYQELSNWINNKPTIRDKIQIIDSNDIIKEVRSYVIAYLDRKLTPSVNSIALSLLGINSKQTGINLEAHNIPALAFMSPPGTSKTYSIVDALKKLSEGQGNSIIAGWLHYDVTKHEATTSPLVLPTANQDVKDEPLPGLAILRASGKVELDKALRENIYTKTVNKIISTFAYILNAGKEKGQISLSNEVENTLKQGIDLNSIEAHIWKLVVMDELDEKTIRELLDALTNVILGFVAVTNALQGNKEHINKNAEALINAISNNHLGSSDPEKDVKDFCEIALILHKLITFGLVLTIALRFKNFISTEKLDEDISNNTEILDGIMYIYNKIHNNYLHRIISTVFLIEALLNTSGNYEDLFKKMKDKLNIGLGNLLNAYYKWITNPETKAKYLDLESKVDSLDTEQAKTFEFYNKFYMFLINAQANEKNEYVFLDQMFMNTVLVQLVDNVNNKTSGSKLPDVRETGNNPYRGAKTRQYSGAEYSEGEFDYFSDNKLSFTDHIRLISDTINDLCEAKRFFSNIAQNNPSNQEGKTTLEKLKSEFGTRFLDFKNTREDDVPHILARIFNFIDLIKKELVKLDYEFYESVYENKEHMKILRNYKDALKKLFTKSLNVIVYSPRYGHLINNRKIDTTGVDINELIGDYILSGLGITESLQTKGISYSFPPAVLIFLLRAKQAYYKYLRQLRAMIEANMKRMDETSSFNEAVRNLRPPLYVLFIDEMMTQLTPENFLFWLNIWNGLISPANPTVDTYPPNLCFILAGNMPWSTFILEQALSQSGSGSDPNAFRARFKEFNISNMISEDTVNALGSRISLRVVAYDYTYLLRTDESAVRTRTALFIRALTKGLLRREGLIHFVNNAQNLLGGFYDYYETIVLPRLKSLGSLKLGMEQKMKLHAYIASLTAAPDNIPFNLANIEPNSTIKNLIETTYQSDVSPNKVDEVIRKATILNYLFNNKTFGKTIYEYMFGTYFEKKPKEADYFNRLITIAISPIVLHLSFMHSYLTWNNMMRRVSKHLVDKAKKSQDKSEIVDAITKLMKVIKDASLLLNTKMTTSESIESIMGKTIDIKNIRDRLDSGTYQANLNYVMEYLKSQRDPRFCDPEVGAVISLLSLVFYHYIKYMKEFNKDISKSIVKFCEALESLIKTEASRMSEDTSNKGIYADYFTTLKDKIYNYFIAPDQDINSRKDLLTEASEYAYNLNESVRINLLSFDRNETTFEVTKSENEKSSETYPKDADSSITVTLIPKKGDSNVEKGLDEDDIKAIKALVAYTIYTHSLVSRKDENKVLNFSPNLISNILVSNREHAPLVGHLALGFFRITEENKLFLIQPLRETDRWFTSVTGSIVKYVTIMTILKHILTYRYIDNMPDMIKGFMEEAKNSNAFSESVGNKLESILNEFAELLYEARQAVFTPIAKGGEQSQNERYYLFNYTYNEPGDTKYEGYYTKPDNKVNFGPLGFVFEKLKDLSIVEYDKSNNNSENSGENLINNIAERFVQYLKDQSQKSTTSFFPIHLISHIESKTESDESEDSANIPSDFKHISSLIYNNNNIEYITVSDNKYEGGQLNDFRHESFYNLKKDKDCSIYGLIKVLNSKLKNIEEFKSITLLSKQNEQLEKASASGNNNFIRLLQNFQSKTNDYQKIEINDGIFEDLKKVSSRYNSIGDYLRLWNTETERQNIIMFFKNLLEAVVQENLDELSKTAASILKHLDEYIVEVASKLSKEVADKNVQQMLKQISSKDKINSYIESTIKNIMNSDLKNYVAGDRITYPIIRGDETQWAECIKYQIMLLEPLIKYSLAIILSNIVLVEAAQDTNKEKFYNQLREAIENCYNKTIQGDDVAASDYLSMIIRYIFFDINQKEVDESTDKIKLSDALITKTAPNLQEDLLDPTTNTADSYHLVKPFFTHYDKEMTVLEKEGQNNNKVVKKREVFTQYVYRVDGENPNLYCDIHHMPIKGVQKIDGTLIEVPSKITIYSSEAFKSDQPGYTYTQLTFIRNMVIPRYEFAKSALVNLLLITGIQEIQTSLSNVTSMVSSFSNARFAPFAITNLYLYYYNEINDSNLNALEFINKVIKNRNSGGKHKHLHPLLAAIILLFNKYDEDVKIILENDYGLKKPETYSRRDDFINALRLRFYSSENIGNIQSTEYDMYSIYEPGVSIK